MSYCSNDNLIIDPTVVSPNHNSRILFLVLHYTADNLEGSLKTLTTPEPLSTNPVSAHYVVPEAAIDNQRKVYQLVHQDQRAWHAGVSSWQNRSNINDTSIGIEIVNLGYTDDKQGNRTWYTFPDYQIDTVIELAKNIVDLYQIMPTRVVGHLDIAVGRKVDPGPLFPWEKLYKNGIGAWFDKEEVNLSKVSKKNQLIDIKQLQTNLKKYGYNIVITGKLDEGTRNAVQAFQMHFRPSDYSGNPDLETIAILENLIKKYF